MWEKAMLDICVYCEESAEELVAKGAANGVDEALRLVSLGDREALLCPDCRCKYAAWFDDELDELMFGPVTFPPGVLVVEHVCPELEFQGFPLEAATSILELTSVEGGEPGYLYATCPHCQVTVRSLAEG